ncbi:MAG: sulfatase-like hydrolase/transferase [Planctomycetota bacterium]
MKRFLLLLIITLISAVSICAADKPNILWLVSEDNDCYLGCYGDKLARTPTIDKLASEGVLYERCFSQPVCAPSRFTLITGMYPTTCGPAQHMRAHGKIPDWLKGFPTYLRDAGYFTSNNSKTDYNSPINAQQAWNENGKNGHWKHRGKDQPFFSVFNHEVTHESCLFPTKELALNFPSTDPASIRIKPYQPDTPEMRADWVRYYNHMALMDGQIAAKLKELADAGLADNTIVFYYSDNGGVLARSKRFLQESGTHVPLVVYYPPKWRHLAPAAPGSRIKEPVHFIDFAPTVLSLAGVKIPDYMQGRAYAGTAKAEPNEYVFSSRDRMDERYDIMRSAMDKQYLYIHNFRPDLPFVQPLNYMFQARAYQSWAKLAKEGKLTPATSMFWGEKPAEELYDCFADPDSIHNLASDPAHKATLERMRVALEKRCVANKDNGFMPEGSELEGYDASHAAGAFPIERVYALACLAAERNAENLPKLIEALNDPSEAIRWWGAQGCTMLREKAVGAESALRKTLDDKSGAVQVAAAEALARMGKLDAALPVLDRCIRDTKTGFTALHAANVLFRLGESARPVSGTIKKVMTMIPKNAGANSLQGYLARITERMTDVFEGREEGLVYPGTGAK